SQVQFQETEQELVVLITPHLIDPQDCNQVTKRLPGRETRNPDDYELFLESILEAPRGQRVVFPGRKYRPAYLSDPTAGQFPCSERMPKQGRGGAGNGACDGGCEAYPGARSTTPGMTVPAAPGEIDIRSGMPAAPSGVLPAPGGTGLPPGVPPIPGTGG